MKILPMALSAAAVMLMPHVTFAQSQYQGQHGGKLKVKDKLQPAVYAFELKDVKLGPGRFYDNMQREDKWLMSIPVNSLLHSFRTNAGEYSGLEGGYATRKISGWESLDSEIRGHTTGHILSGLAMLYGSTQDPKYKLKGDSLVSGLAKIQRTLNQGGYLSAFPQELINRNLNGQRVWAPWYTLHKILSGLIDQYLDCDNVEALEIAKGMSSWAYQKLKDVKPEQRTLMLRNEFGGVNDAFFNLYALTGNEQDKWLGDFFYHNETLDPLKSGKDILDKKHANTFIPKLIGLTRKYELEGKGDGDEVAAFFWNTVVNHHTFATGSNSDKEHFFEPDALSKHLSGYTGESCNVYNMLKLTRHLYTHSMDPKYMEYYERALFNHILGQQDPESGMISYFLPLKAGAHKVYSTRDSSFWCCVGSGFENQAKYSENVYYHTKSAVVVNLYLPTQLDWKEKGFRLEQQTSFPEDGRSNFTVLSAEGSVDEIRFRYPSWATQGMQISLNGTPLKISQAPGSYIVVKRKWKKGDRISLNFPMPVRLIPTNDDPNITAIAYGPIVLAGQLGRSNFQGRQPFSNPQKYNDYYTYDYHYPENIDNSLKIDKNNLENSIEKQKNTSLTFKIKGQAGLILRPLYDTHRQRYIVYWNTAPTP